MSRISKFGLVLMLFILVADLEAYLAPNVHNPEWVFDGVIYLIGALLFIGRKEQR